MAELTERARAISRDAGTKVSSAMREMISSAAGIAGFAVESAKDLGQYMVRRGQMTQDEADKLVRDAEAAYAKRPKAEREKLAATRAAAEKAAADKRAARTAAENALPANKPLSKTVKTAPLRPAPAAVPEPPKAEKVEKPVAKVAAKAAAPAKKPAPAKKAPAKKAVAKKKK
jgi:polyhydroxyalkanoate synthesis regulator phasin